MDFEKMMIEGELIWKSWIDEIRREPWYSHLAKWVPIILVTVGMTIAMKTASFTLGWIVLIVAIAYVLFWVFWLRKRIDRRV